MRYLILILLLSFSFSECDDLNVVQCSSNTDCEWIEDIVNMSCSGFTIETCNMQDECFLDQDCIQWGSWYSWICYDYGPLYCSGSYEVDNSYCQENPNPPTCSEMNELQCGSNPDCEWITTYQWYNCNNFQNYSQCNNYSEYGCYWYDHWYYSGWDSCNGPSFQVENGGYCQDNPNSELECSELDENYCNHPEYGEECDWVENIETENCHDILDCTGGCTWQDCEAIEGCWWHFGTAYYDPSGCYGEHETDNSYCEESDYIQGDLNGDLILNILDVIIIVDIILSQESSDLADINGDGIVNILDVIELVDIIINT